jgi:hypothetical protein
MPPRPDVQPPTGLQPSAGADPQIGVAQRIHEHRLDRADHLRQIGERNGNTHLQGTADRMEDRATTNFIRRTEHRDNMPGGLVGQPGGPLTQPGVPGGPVTQPGVPPTQPGGPVVQPGVPTDPATPPSTPPTLPAQPEGTVADTLNVTVPATPPTTTQPSATWGERVRRFWSFGRR